MQESGMVQKLSEADSIDISRDDILDCLFAILPQTSAIDRFANMSVAQLKTLLAFILADTFEGKFTYSLRSSRVAESNMLPLTTTKGQEIPVVFTISDSSITQSGNRLNLPRIANQNVNGLVFDAYVGVLPYSTAFVPFGTRGVDPDGDFQVYTATPISFANGVRLFIDYYEDDDVGPQIRFISDGTSFPSNSKLEMFWSGVFLTRG